MNDPLEITTLGGLEIRVGGEPVTGFESDKVRALLVYLVVESERPHRRERLAGLLWPDYPEPSARRNLRTVLANLRRVIGDQEAKPPVLNISRQTIEFNRASGSWVDVNAFNDLIASRVSEPAAIRHLEEALDLYQGSFLEGFSLPDSAAFEEWALLERERLQRLFVETLRELMAHHLDCGAYKTALAHARRLLELDPESEGAHRGVMVCLARTGQRAAALTQYSTCRTLLEQELGVEPDAETMALYDQILAGEIAQPVEAVARPRHNLPVQTTPFVGRQAVLEEINRLLKDPACHLLTLVGPGGSGKTRLALEAGAAQLERYAHGVYFVSLAPLNSPESIVPTLADALGFTFYAGAEPQQQLLNYLRGKTMLLVMDNYEHLLAPPLSRPEGGTQGGAVLVTEILRTAPNVKVLVTSRARLNVGGEFRYRVTGMDYPDPERPTQEWGETSQYSAVKLFLQGARRAQSGFELTDENLSGVVRICRLVEGMPLGIRLAAGWVDTLTPTEIANEINESLDLLETELRDVPERQQSMRAALDHSWRLLAERERAVMGTLSVFRGGFTREAARAVTGATLRELRALANKSLLERTPAGRYEVHELLREYAAEKLEQSLDAANAARAVRDRHSAFYAAALQEWAVDLKGARQVAALAEMRSEGENARLAWDWAVDRGQVERLDQAVEALCLFYLRRGRLQEGETACRMAADSLAAKVSSEGPVMSHSDASQSAVEGMRVRAKLLAEQSIFSRYLGRTELASQLLRQSLALLEGPELADQDTRAERARALYEMGIEAGKSGAREEERRLNEQSLALYRALGDRWGTARLLGASAIDAWNVGNYSAAQQCGKESLALRRALGDQWGTGNALHVLGDVARTQGQLEESERLLREASAIHHEMSYRGTVSMADLLCLGWTLLFRGKYPEAHMLSQEALTHCEDTGQRAALGWVLVRLASARLHLGRYEEARAQAQMSLTLARELGRRGEYGCPLRLLGSVALTEEAYSEAQQSLGESVAIFRELRDRNELCVALAVWAYAARGLGDLRQAEAHLCEALRTAADIGAFEPLITALPAMALLLADQGEAERAVELYALASCYPHVANSRWFEDVAGKHIAAVAATLPPDVVAAAQERGRARDLWETAEVLLQELLGFG